MNDDRADRRHYVAVVAVVGVVLVLGGGAFVQESLLLHTSGAVQPVVQADAEVTADPSNETGEPGTVTVTWTSAGPSPDGSDGDGGADYLTVQWAATNGTEPANADLGHREDLVGVTAGTWRLAEVGHAVTLSERNATAATTVRVVVTAVSGDARTVIAARDVTL